MSRAGFSLVEMLVALAIVTMVGAVTAPSLSRALDGARFNGAAREIANALKAARLEARSGRGESVVVLDVEAQEYVLSGRTRALAVPGGTRIELLTAESEQLGPSTGAIRFFPDGSSTGGTVTLLEGRREAVIAVDWLTGHVAIRP